MSSRYAAATAVPVERSRAELERTLHRYGADAFVFGWDQKGAMVQFGYRGRNVRVQVPYPGPTGSQKKHEQAQRQRWRILLLLVKSQIEAVECGLMKFEEAFLPWLVLKDGQTVLQTMVPQLPPADPSVGRLKEAHR